jgi:CheY-like chemotaxis protein
MSHEIRTPISGIIGLSELMIQSNLDQDQQEHITTISQSAESLLAIINDILDFSKIEAGHMDIETIPFRPKKIVDCLRSLMSLPAGEKNLQIYCQYELENDLTLLGDPGRLRQILTNLLSNAIKFTEEGSITLTVRESPLQPPPGLALGKAVDPQSFGWSQNSVRGKYIEFVVEDTGCGISDETMKRLFRPFSQADSSTARTHGGTGLGLTISRRLAELMGGSIDLYSPRSGGCRGTLWIPFQRCMSEASPDSRPIIRPISPISYRKSLKAAYQASVPGVPCPVERQTMKDHVELKLAGRNDIHILVVEDNPVNQTIVSANLKKLGFTVSIVENGEQALTYLDGVATSKETVPNVILMDCMMPVMDGYDTTQNLRNDAQRFSTGLRQTPIIALTASAIQGDRERCKAAGMNDYLTKPVSRDNLKRAIDAWILKPNDELGNKL